MSRCGKSINEQKKYKLILPEESLIRYLDDLITEDPKSPEYDFLHEIMITGINMKNKEDIRNELMTEKYISQLEKIADNLKKYFTEFQTSEIYIYYPNWVNHIFLFPVIVETLEWILNGKEIIRYQVYGNDYFDNDAQESTDSDEYSLNEIDESDDSDDNEIDEYEEAEETIDEYEEDFDDLEAHSSIIKIEKPVQIFITLEKKPIIIPKKLYSLAISPSYLEKKINFIPKNNYIKAIYENTDNKKTNITDKEFSDMKKINLREGFTRSCIETILETTKKGENKILTISHYTLVK